MKTYFTTVLSAGNGNFKKWRVEEVTSKDSHFGVLKQFKMLFETFEAAEDEVMKKISKEGGRLMQAIARPGITVGTKRAAYKPRTKRGKT